MLGHRTPPVFVTKEVNTDHKDTITFPQELRENSEWARDVVSAGMLTLARHGAPGLISSTTEKKQ